MNGWREHVRSFAPTRASPRLHVVLCALLCVIFGCEKKHASDDPSTQPTVAAASPEHYLPNAATPRPTTVPRVKPAPKPTATLAANATCMTAECHATLMTAPQIHAPVAKAACNACHEDDVGGHRFPLKRKGNENCTFCHGTVLTGQPHLHKAIETGCTSCHNPHVSNTKFLLKADTVERTCAACHDVPLKPHAHEPFAKGECTLCHFSHEAPNKKLLRGGDNRQHCFMCHDTVKQTLAKSVHTHQPAMKDCNTCHSPHATDFPHQLKQPTNDTCLSCHDKIKKHIAESPVAHGAMVMVNGCGNCHDAHASQNSELLRKRADELCLTCHDKPVATKDGRTVAGMKAVFASKFLHGPNKVGNCSACHDPHGSKRANLLDRSFPDSFYTRFDIKKYELCFNCHEPQMVLDAKTSNLTNFRDGERNLHFVHVNREDKGRSCRTCHDVHGSDLPKHMASSVPFEGSNWSMPIGFEPMTDGGRCAPGCHTPKEYHRQAASLAAPATQMSTTTTQPTTAPTTRGVS